jgi:hypothetical protein
VDLPIRDKNTPNAVNGDQLMICWEIILPDGRLPMQVLPRHHAACNTASFHLKQTTPKTSDGRRGTDYFHGIELIRKGSAISKSCDRSHFLVAAR